MTNYWDPKNDNLWKLHNKVGNIAWVESFITSRHYFMDEGHQPFYFMTIILPSAHKKLIKKFNEQLNII